MSRKLSSVIISPFMTILSFIFTRCGETKSPTVLPSDKSIAFRYAHTEPFPFVPATWSTLNFSCGSPRHLKNCRVWEGSFFFVNFGMSRIYSTASSYLTFPHLYPDLQKHFFPVPLHLDRSEALSVFHLYIHILWKYGKSCCWNRPDLPG